MVQNKLVFGPDNDTDDYTQVIAYINTEFARIQAEEEKRIETKKEKNDTENDTKINRHINRSRKIL